MIMQSSRCRKCVARSLHVAEKRSSHLDTQLLRIGSILGNFSTGPLLQPDLVRVLSITGYSQIVKEVAGIKQANGFGTVAPQTCKYAAKPSPTCPTDLQS